MTAYTDQSELTTRFGAEELLGIADRDGDGTIDADVVTQAIAAAQATIDSYIGTRYALPLVTVPATVKKVCQDLARYELYTIEAPKAVSDKYDQAIAWLKDISAGRASLDAPAPAAADSTQSGNTILLKGTDRRMSRHQLRKL
ncbi:MAG TPA: DUF1320 domain-containing protein [Reyranella sp.]|jgi:phage gp36-like protein|nr:DUF1320 domain-containing protein [Reyranella sp.]